MWIIIMFFTVGIILDGITLAYVARYFYYLRDKVAVKGDIIDFKSTVKNGERLYYPVMSYKDLQGETIKAQSFYGTNPPLGKVGDKVKIYYPAHEPENFDFSFRLTNWGFVYIFGLVGTVFLGFGILTLIYLHSS